MEKRIFKDKAYSMLAAMIKAMASPHRLEILDLLGLGERTVEAIAGETGMSVANTSRHLQVLKGARLLQMKRDGNFIYYKLAHPDIYASWDTLRRLGMQQMAEMEKLVRDFRDKRNSLEALSLEELLARMRRKDLVVLDVRPAAEFNAGHIAGAINIPVERLGARLRALSKNKEYIAYCRGPFCVFADEAVDLLTQKGFKAKRLIEGFPHWKIRGLPIDTIV